MERREGHVAGGSSFGCRVAAAHLSARVAVLTVSYKKAPQPRMNAVGITGTNGKTTTTYLLRSIFEAAGEKVGLLGTIQYSVGPKLLPSDNTTPGADTLQRYFSEMLAAG